MKSNNPFQTHNIGHLSPSSINSFIADPCLWVMRYLFNIREKSGVGAIRGTSLEYVQNEKFKNGFFDYDLLDQHFTKLCVEQDIDLLDDKTAKEQQSLIKYASIIDTSLNYSNLEDYQEKVELSFDDLPIPILGYIDYKFPEVIVDLKTTNRMPSKPTNGQQRQMAFYSMAYPAKQVQIFFVSPREHKVFTLSKNDLKYSSKTLLQGAFTIQRFLSLSNDKNELASFIYPNFDKWEWSELMKNEAKNIWRI